jgi:hypothetical protein
VSQLQRLLIIITVISCGSDRNVRPEVTGPDICQYFFLHILKFPLYFKFFILIFNTILYHCSRNYFLTTAYEIATSFITVKWRHPKLAIVQHAIHLAPPCQMKFPAWVKHTKTPVCYTRNHSLHHLHKRSIGLNYRIQY